MGQSGAAFRGNASMAALKAHVGSMSLSSQPMVLLTKLDSTARGGIVVALQEEYHLPVTWIGTGEGMEDLAPFAPEGFTAVMFEGR